MQQLLMFGKLLCSTYAASESTEPIERYYASMFASYFDQTDSQPGCATVNAIARGDRVVPRKLLYHYHEPVNPRSPSGLVEDLTVMVDCFFSDAIRHDALQRTLEQLECTGADAYRHILAWIHLFEQEGFCSINHVATAVSADALYLPTETILQALPREPVQQILERTYVPKPSEANLCPSRKLAFFSEPEKKVQMNIRMTVKDKKNFVRFCRKYRLKSREALELLLDQVTGEDTRPQRLLFDQKALREENIKLKKQLAVRSGKELPVREKRSEAYLHFLQKGIEAYIQYLFPAENEEVLPAVSYNRFRKQTNIRYEYPQEEGFLMLTAEASLWGRNRSRFNVGRGENGELIKLRYYSKPWYTGVLIWNYPNGTRWMAGCRKAADGAMELTAAFPMPQVPEETVEENTPAQSERRPSLDDLIRTAEKKQ